MPHIREMEHPASAYSQKDREDGDDIGMDAKTIPQQRKDQTYRTGEMDIQPLLRIL